MEMRTQRSQLFLARIPKNIPQQPSGRLFRRQSAQGGKYLLRWGVPCGQQLPIQQVDGHRSGKEVAHISSSNPSQRHLQPGNLFGLFQQVQRLLLVRILIWEVNLETHRAPPLETLAAVSSGHNAWTAPPALAPVPIEIPSWGLNNLYAIYRDSLPLRGGLTA